MRDYDFIIHVRLDDGDPRVCDYCNKLLVGEDGLTVASCHSTDHGLVCDKCLAGMTPFSSYGAGVYVKEESWYKGI